MHWDTNANHTTAMPPHILFDINYQHFKKITINRLLFRSQVQIPDCKPLSLPEPKSMQMFWYSLTTTITVTSKSLVWESRRLIYMQPWVLLVNASISL